MNDTHAAPKAAKPGKEWQKTSYANLIRYVPSGIYYARLRVKGKLIRKNLKTDLLSVGKLRLGGFRETGTPARRVCRFRFRRENDRERCH